MAVILSLFFRLLAIYLVIKIIISWFKPRTDKRKESSLKEQPSGRNTRFDENGKSISDGEYTEIS
jgi:hypothetical protein